jgi:hypothetical protein
VWEGILALDEATQHDVLRELRVRLVAFDTGGGEYLVRFEEDDALVSLNASVLSFSRTTGTGRTGWLEFKAGPRRVLEIGLEEPDEVWARAAGPSGRRARPTGSSSPLTIAPSSGSAAPLRRYGRDGQAGRFGFGSGHFEGRLRRFVGGRVVARVEAMKLTAKAGEEHQDGDQICPRVVGPDQM